MKFAYRRYAVNPIPGFGSTLYRPAIPLRVIGHAGEASVTALLDTGSDTTLLPRSLGEAIGADIDDDGRRSRVGGVGGQLLEMVSGTVELQLQHDGLVFHWQTTVGFITAADPQDEHVILGYIGCLQFFIATFDSWLKEVTIFPNDSFPGTAVRR